MESIYYQNISPRKVFRGNTAWEEGKVYIPTLSKRPLVLGRSKETYSTRKSIIQDLKDLGLNPIPNELKYDCCDSDIIRLKAFIQKENCDSVIATGGGKVLDAGKLIAQNLSIPCITIPLSSATCAGWTALANIYSPEGFFQRDIALTSCPDLFIFNHGFIKTAPRRTISSGVADALAKWYEAALTSNESSDGLVQQALQMARVLRDQLFLDSYEAYKNVGSDSWRRVIEGNAITAGLIGGIGGSQCRTAIAHSLHNGLTQLEATNHSIHGEIVGFGILVQLRLEEIVSYNKLASQARNQLIPFLRKLNLPINLNQIGLSEISLKDLKKACDFACIHNADITKIPFSLNSEILLESIIDVNKETVSMFSPNKELRKTF